MTRCAAILDATGLRLTKDEMSLFRDVRPFGFILFARNIENANQVRALCDDFREAAGEDCIVTIDQEGGRVQRLRSPLARNWRPPLDFVHAAGDEASQAMYLRYRLIAAELKALGINSNCAPMVDLAWPQTHPFLKNRCYGSDPTQVAAIGRAVAQGLMDGGVLPVLKHIPGHGRSAMDSHHDLPRVTQGIGELGQTDFAPFAELSDLPAGMTAHLVFDDIDDRPATLSPKVIGLIRQQIGFDGLLMTDDISMRALSGRLGDIARDALGAGCDLVLACNRTLEERAEVANAAGGMSRQSTARADRALASIQCAVPLDIAAAEAEVLRLTGGRAYDG